MKQPNILNIVTVLGGELDAMQNARLNFAMDPVYSHLATLSTAAALSGVEWAVRERRGKTTLGAVRHIEGKRDKKNLHTTSRELLAGRHQIDRGLSVVGRIKFGYLAEGSNRQLPVYGIDQSLTSVWNFGRKPEIKSSEILLERTSKVFGGISFEVGVIALHSSFAQQHAGVAPVNEGNVPSNFEEIVSKLYQPAPTVTEDIFGGSLLANIRGDESVPTTLPSAHFAFHESLGVPPAIVDLGRRNFTTLVEYSGLPYVLSD